MIRLISWNVNGIRASVKKDFYAKVAEMSPDILCLQETKSQDDTVEQVALKLPEYKYYVNSAEKKGYSGTAVFTKTEPENVIYDIGKDDHDKEGRVITLEYEKFYLVNVYIPNSGQELKRLEYRKIWDADLLAFIDGLQSKKPVVWTGDFNVAHKEIDLARPKQNYNKTAGYTQVEIDGFDAIVNKGFVDTFRYLHPDKVQYTFWNQRFGARARNVGWRIDYFLVSKNLMDKVKSASILDDVHGSDHCPIVLEIDF